MKKTLLIVALVAAALIAFGAGTVFAQDAQPPYNGGGRGGMMGGGDGALHTFMVVEFAKQLNLNVNDVNTRLDAGESMYDIALSAGVTAEEFPAVMTSVRVAALDAAVKANVITQEQADWMNQHEMGQGRYGNGNCPMYDGDEDGANYGRGQGRGMMGGGGRWQQSAPQTNP
ncbi:MAG: hypothetical protein Fur002_09410 [Anaerolineales bacterium]